eukprot:COSAG05_NODE_203_length_14207_cov_24.645379_9_plen_84_part_00
MSGLNPTELKRRRRAAARTLLSDPRGISVAKKKHLVDGVWVDKLPFNAGHAWRAQQALLEADRLADHVTEVIVCTVGDTLEYR